MSSSMQRWSLHRKLTLYTGFASFQPTATRPLSSFSPCPAPQSFSFDSRKDQLPDHHPVQNAAADDLFEERVVDEERVDRRRDTPSQPIARAAQKPVSSSLFEEYVDPSAQLSNRSDGEAESFFRKYLFTEKQEKVTQQKRLNKTRRNVSQVKATVKGPYDWIHLHRKSAEQGGSTNAALEAFSESFTSQIADLRRHVDTPVKKRPDRRRPNAVESVQNIPSAWIESFTNRKSIDGMQQHWSRLSASDRQLRWDPIVIYLLTNHPLHTLDFLVATDNTPSRPAAYKVAGALQVLSAESMQETWAYAERSRLLDVVIYLIERRTTGTFHLPQETIVTLLRHASLETRPEHLTELYSILIARAVHLRPTTFIRFAHSFARRRNIPKALDVLRRARRLGLDPNSLHFKSASAAIMRNVGRSRALNPQSKQILRSIRQTGVEVNPQLQSILIRNALDHRELKIASRILYSIRKDAGIVSQPVMADLFRSSRRSRHRALWYWTNEMLKKSRQSVSSHPENTVYEMIRAYSSFCGPNQFTKTVKLLARHRNVKVLQELGIIPSSWTLRHQNIQYAHCAGNDVPPSSRMILFILSLRLMDDRSNSAIKVGWKNLSPRERRSRLSSFRVIEKRRSTAFQQKHSHAAGSGLAKRAWKRVERRVREQNRGMLAAIHYRRFLSLFKAGQSSARELARSHNTWHLFMRILLRRSIYRLKWAKLLHTMETSLDQVSIETLAANMATSESRLPAEEGVEESPKATSGTFRIIIHRLVHDGALQQAEEALSEMERRDLPLDKNVIFCRLAVYSKQGNDAELLQVIETMISQKFDMMNQSAWALGRHPDQERLRALLKNLPTLSFKRAAGRTLMSILHKPQQPVPSSEQIVRPTERVEQEMLVAVR